MTNDYFNLLEKYQKRKEEIENISYNSPDYKKGQKELNNFMNLLEALERYNKISIDQVNLFELQKISDEDMAQEIQSDIQNNETLLKNLQEEIAILLLEESEITANKIILEVRAGTGGDEASLFGADLLKMYLKYAETQKWKHKILDSSINEAGGIKSCSVSMEGDNIYKRLCLESGVHRVQRIPTTEANGRIHTSTATVSILPAEEEIDIKIEDKDIKIDTYRASGAGGQHVNKTESAIRITHFPSGIVVTCQDGRSQLDNRETAMKSLLAKLETKYRQDAQNAQDNIRRDQIGSGDRSEKIRTYNYPENRITDHRFKITVYRLNLMMEGDIDDFLKEIKTAYRKII